jgi:Ca-activated chloride channel family protein
MFIRYSHIRNHVKSGMLILLFMLGFTGLSWAQADRKLIRQGNREYEKDKFSESEISYRRAIDKNKESSDAVFNTGDALYKQKKFEDAGKQFIDSHKMNEEKDKKSASLYNLGNAMLMANKLQESIEAYKNSLKLKPENMEAKYNLAYAQDLLKKQQEQQQKQQQQNKDNKDQNKDQEKKEDENKKQNQKQNDQNKQDNKQEQKQQDQQQQQSISKEDAERLLNAIANDEKNVQEKVKREKAAKARVRTLKNW